MPQQGQSTIPPPSLDRSNPSLSSHPEPPPSLGLLDRTIPPVISFLDRYVPSELGKSLVPIGLSTSLCLLSLPHALKKVPGVPSYFQLIGFGGIFGMCGYMMYRGDYYNGPSTATAWSLTYLLVHGRKGMRSGVGMAVAGSVGVQSVVYGSRTLRQWWYGDEGERGSRESGVGNKEGME